MANAKLQRLYEKQKGICAYCFGECIFLPSKGGRFKRKLLKRQGKAGSAATIDHVVPRSYYRTNKLPMPKSYPIVMACNDCNSRKMSKTPEEFLREHIFWIEPFNWDWRESAMMRLGVHKPNYNIFMGSWSRLHSHGVDWHVEEE